MNFSKPRAAAAAMVTNMRNHLSSILILALTAGAAATIAATTTTVAATPGPSPAPPPSFKTRTSTMPEFAMLFRVTRSLPPDQVAQRAAAVRDWAIRLRAEGTILDAFLFEDAGFAIAAGSRAVTAIVPDGAVAGVTIIQAADLDAALALAKSFPGLGFGTAVEVRARKPLPVPPPAPGPAR